MENWEKKTVDLLKFIPCHQSFENNFKHLPWTNLDQVYSSGNNPDIKLCIRNIRIVLKGNYQDLLNILDGKLRICTNNISITTKIKFLVLIEEHLFDGSKIYFDKLIGGWIIPLNISLFINNNCFIINQQADRLYILLLDNNNYLKDDYYFQIQCSEENPISNKDGIRFKSTFCAFENRLYLNLQPLFFVIWETDIKKLVSITFEQKKIFAYEFKRVKIMEEQAVIIPIGSFKSLKYILNMKMFNYAIISDLFLINDNNFIDFEFTTNTDTVNNIEILYFHKI